MLTIDYTSAAGWHYSGQVPLPQYDVTFSTDVSSSPPGRARFATSVDGPIASSGRTGIDTGLGDDNPGRPNGPRLILGIELAYKLTADSPSLEAGACSTSSTDSSEDITSARQEGYPFDVAMVCDPPDGSSPQSGITDDMDENQAESLADQLNGERPTYVLTITTSDLSDGRSCIVFLDANMHLKKVTQAMIPPGANVEASSDCSTTQLSLG